MVTRKQIKTNEYATKTDGDWKLCLKYAILYNHSTNYNIKSLEHYKSQLHKFKSWHKNICFLKEQQLVQRQHFFRQHSSIMNPKLVDT
jgi:hypothetical protein